MDRLVRVDTLPAMAQTLFSILIPLVHSSGKTRNADLARDSLVTTASRSPYLKRAMARVGLTTTLIMQDS